MYIFLHGPFYQKIPRVCREREHSRRGKKWQHIRTLIVVDPERNHPTCCPSLASYKDRKGYAFPFISFKETSGNDRYSGIKWNECCTVFSRHVMKWLMAKHRNPFRLLSDFGSNKMKPLNIGDLEPERPFSLWFVHRQIHRSSLNVRSRIALLLSTKFYIAIFEINIIFTFVWNNWDLEKIEGKKVELILQLSADFESLKLSLTIIIEFTNHAVLMKTPTNYFVLI